MRIHHTFCITSTIPNSVNRLRARAFANNHIVDVTMPERIQNTEDGVFSNNIDVVDGGFEVALSTNGRLVWIIGYVGEETDIRIPSEVHGAPIFGIWNDAFAGRQLTSVVIDEGIATISYGAFRDNQLTSVTLPDSVTTLAGDAFAGNQLASVPVTAQQMQQAERQAEQLAEQQRRHAEAEQASRAEQARLATLPYSPESDFQVAPVGGGVSVRIIRYTGSDWTVRIPPRIRGLPVTHIGPNAFRNSNLIGVTIPNTVTHIENDAFRGNQLTSIAIPSSVTHIGQYAFSQNLLTSVTIPSSVTAIGHYAFTANQLASVTIPNSVTAIGARAFANNQLTNVTIPSSVTAIGAQAFADNQLTNVTIPSSVTSIGHYAFRNNQLTNVTIPNSVTFLASRHDGFSPTRIEQRFNWDAIFDRGVTVTRR